MSPARRTRSEPGAGQPGTAKPEADAREQARDAILLATLPHIAFDGCTERALRAGAEDAGVSAAEADLAFPGGMGEVIAHWSVYADRTMMAEMESRDLSAMRTRDRVATAVRVRIGVNAEHKEAVRRALAFLSLPHNTVMAASATLKTVNAIWYAAGDTASDFSYYTKRALLAPVYSGTVLYWLADTSEDNADTWAFLDRRLDEVLMIPQFQARMQDMMSRIPFSGTGGSRRRRRK